MSEGELAEQIQMGRQNIAFFVSLIMSALSIMIAATHYFLRREGIGIRIGVFALYSAGYIAMLSLYQWEIEHLRAISIELGRLAYGPDGTEAGKLIVAWQAGPADLQIWLPWLLFIAGWVMVAIYLFLYDHAKLDD